MNKLYKSFISVISFLVLFVVLFSMPFPFKANATVGVPVAGNYLSNGQVLVGSTGAAPVAATITGTAGQVTVTNGAGTITLSAPQSISTTSSPTFSNLTLTNGISASTGSYSGAVSAGSLAVSAGALTLYSRSEAQILAIDPVVAGELYFCSDCTTTTVCVSTGTAVADMAAIEDPAAACD